MTDLSLTLYGAEEYKQTKFEYEEGIRYTIDLTDIFIIHEHLFKEEGMSITDTVMTFKFLVEEYLLAIREHADVNTFLQASKSDWFALKYATWASENIVEIPDVSHHGFMKLYTEPFYYQKLIGEITERILLLCNPDDLGRRLITIPEEWYIMHNKHDIVFVKLKLIL